MLLALWFSGGWWWLNLFVMTISFVKSIQVWSHIMHPRPVNSLRRRPKTRVWEQLKFPSWVTPKILDGRILAHNYVVCIYILIVLKSNRKSKARFKGESLVRHSFRVARKFIKQVLLNKYVCLVLFTAWTKNVNPIKWFHSWRLRRAACRWRMCWCVMCVKLVVPNRD